MSRSALAKVGRFFLASLCQNGNLSQNETMRKLPKWPKGLKARLAKAKRKAQREKDIADRKREIEAAKKELKKLIK